MTQQEINENIEIARRYLNSFHLLLPDDEVLFDCFCLPSFKYNAFYAQIYKINDVYRANCAYTRYADYLGIESYSCHFSSIEIKKHPAKQNDVFCKIIFLNPEAVNSLISIAQDYTVKDNTPKEGMIIDGITAGIRFFDNGTIFRDIVMINPDKPEPLLDEICSFSDMI